MTQTEDELAVLCLDEAIPPGVRAERGFRALRVRGPLAFSQCGVLAGLAGPLADAGVPILALSTFDTDYVLVRTSDLERARAALRSAGHRIHARGG